MYYVLEHKLRKITKEEACTTPSPLICLYTYPVWEQHYCEFHLPPGLINTMPKSCEGIHFCKLESFPTYLLGTLTIPTKHHIDKRRQIIFYIEKNKLTFIDNTDFTANLLTRFIKLKHWEDASIETFFVDFLEALINNDLLYVEELENRMSKLEVAALNGDVPHFNHKMMTFRKEILTYHYFYSQLIDVCEVLIENENHFFSPDNLHLFEVFTRRVERLQSIVLMLRDSATQIREEYQSQIDIKQNHTMRILTVVTSIFLPLTLIVGWYGMNFEYMPELTWRYGYSYVTVLSIVITLICLWIFKRIHFL